MRLRKLIRNDVQLKLTLYFTLLTMFGMVFQFLLLLSNMSKLAGEPGTLASPDEIVFDAASATLWMSFAIVLPICIVIGVLTTFRIAGPIYRFSKFLEQVREGRHPERCVLRKTDELQDLCALLNDVTAPLRSQMRSQAERSAPEAEESAPEETSEAA